MHIALRWDSLYRYSQGVRLLHTELRVLPADGFGQRRIRGSLMLAPHASPRRLTDAFGNEYHHADFLDELTQLHVALEAEVETGEEAAPAPAVTPLLRHLFLAPTERCPFDPDVERLIAGVPPDLEPAAAGEALAALLHERFAFELGATDAGSTALDLLAQGGGVCQDFAHLMLAALRLRGVPARYVSGYLAPPEGEDVSEASHAWVQLLTPGGWRGFDPSAGAPQDERYIVAAVGRDYDDAPPLRGTFTGLANQHSSAVLRIRVLPPAAEAQAAPPGGGGAGGEGAGA